MRNKKKIIIIVLCMAVLLLAVVYAAFATKLTISSKGNITSNWNVYFESISSTVTGQAYNIETPSVSGATARFRVGLKLPGDKMTYRVKVTNGGTVDAYISDVKINNTGSTKVITTVTNTQTVKKGGKLAAGRSGYITINIQLDPDATSLPEETVGDITIELVAVQYTDQEVKPEAPTVETKRLNSLILRDNTAQPDTDIDFSQGSSASNGRGLYYTNTNTENNAKTYYFRGAVENNYVFFLNLTWRIVRINEDETIRLILQDSLAKTEFNINQNDNAYVGYMYGIPESEKSKYGDVNSDGKIDESDVSGLMNLLGNVSNSSLKSYYADLNFDNKVGLDDKTLLNQLIDGETTIDDILANIPDSLRYNRTHTNIVNSSIKEPIDNFASVITTNKYIADTGFCGDRSISTSSGTNKLGYGSNSTDYGSDIRLTSKTKTPQFKCQQANDLYTTSTSNKGNKALTYPAGLITADEVIYAGGTVSPTTSTSDTYLKNLSGSTFWTMTPSNMAGSLSWVWASDGSSISITTTSLKYEIHPVINLKATTPVKSGAGTASDPYVIE